MKRFACVAVAMIALAGCGTPQSRDLLPDSPVAYQPSDISARHTLFVATTREKSEKPREIFDGDRSSELAFANVEITVPRDHKVGQIERPKRGAKPDPSRYFTAESVSVYSGESAFVDALRKDIASHEGRVLVFIHGYRTAFDGAVYRATQLVNDSGYSGTPVLFSWASGATTRDYVYDTNSATAARDRLEQTLRAVVKAGAKRVDIIAHSMGNWVTVEALRQLAMTGDRDLDGRLGDVILASPDIDVDVFKSQMRRYGKPDRPFFILLSGDDRALRISGIIAGNRPRVGDYSNAEELAELGLTVVNLSKVPAGDRLNHAKFADNPTLVKMIGDRLEQDDLGEATDDDVAGAVGGVTRGVGNTITTAAEVIITTPFRVLNVVIGGE